MYSNDWFCHPTKINFSVNITPLPSLPQVGEGVNVSRIYEHCPTALLFTLRSQSTFFFATKKKK